VKRTIRFELDGVTYQVEVERDGDRLTVSRESEQYLVTLLGSASAAASGQPAAGGPALSPAASRPSMKSAPPQAAGVLNAPMTGLVKEIKVRVGSDVAKGDVVLVMEAMKMDVEVSAPATGVVAEIAVRAGDTVESQAPLLIIQ
jgi:biotin carboxyl carrier protein